MDENDDIADYDSDQVTVAKIRRRLESVWSTDRMLFKRIYNLPGQTFKFDTRGEVQAVIDICKNYPRDCTIEDRKQKEVALRKIKETIPLLRKLRDQAME